MDGLRATGEQMVFVDSGDAFFKTFYPDADERPQMRLKAELVRQSYDLMGLDAFVPGELEFTEGRDWFLKNVAGRATFPILAANLFDQTGLKPLFAPSRRVERGGLRILLVGVANPDYNVSQSGQAVRTAAPAPAARKELDAALGAVDLVVAVSHLGLEGDMALAKDVPGVDVIVGGHSGEQLAKPEVVGSTLIVQANKLSKYVGRLELFVDPGARDRVAVPVEERATRPGARLYWSNVIVPLTKDVADDPTVAQLVKGYRDQVVAMHRTAAKAEEPQRKQIFWFQHLCEHCHRQQHAFWRDTRHGRAMATLRRENSHMDLECVGCHTIGFREEGGWRQPDDLGRFEDVQCEACHGPGSDHGDDEYLKRASQEKTCRRCHDVEHHPGFKFEEALEKVRCPKGKKAKQ